MSFSFLAALFVVSLNSDFAAGIYGGSSSLEKNQNRPLYHFGQTTNHVENNMPATRADKLHLCPEKRFVFNYRCLRMRWWCLRNGFYRQVTEMHCCPGYAKEPGKEGCPKDLYISNKTLLQTFKELGLTKFASYLSASGRDTLFDDIDKGPFTIFAPSNRAFTDTARSKANTGGLVRLHIVQGKLVYHAIKTNQVLQSIKDGERLRVAWAPDKETLVIQGAAITNENNPFENGIIHVIDHVIQPSLPLTVSKYLGTSPQFTRFNSLLRKVGTRLAGPVTVFAPSDQAFKRLHHKFLRMVENNEDCLKPFVNFHVLDRSLYTGGIHWRVRVTSRERSHVSILRHKSIMVVEESVITKPDLTLSDGIIHVISDVIIPRSVSFLGPFDLAKIQGARKFTEFVRLHKLHHVITAAESGPYTLFAPSDQAMTRASDVISHVSRNREQMEAFVMRHLIPRKHFVSEMSDGDELQTFGRTDRTDRTDRTGEKLAVNWWHRREVIAVGGACITKANRAVCSGVMHILDRVILPAQGSIIDIIGTASRFKTLSKAIRIARLEEFLKKANGITLFAPSNKAFRKLGNRRLHRLMRNAKKMRHFLQSYMVSDVVYSCMLRHDKLESISRRSLRVLVSGVHMKVNGVAVQEQDIRATNGVVHEIGGMFYK